MINQQSLPAHHLDTVNLNLILHITFICHIIQSLCDIITTI